MEIRGQTASYRHAISKGRWNVSNLNLNFHHTLSCIHPGTDGSSASWRCCAAVFRPVSAMLSISCLKHWMKHTSEFWQGWTRKSENMPTGFCSVLQCPFDLFVSKNSQKFLQCVSTVERSPITMWLGGRRTLAKLSYRHAPV